MVLQRAALGSRLEQVQLRAIGRWAAAAPGIFGAQHLHPLGGDRRAKLEADHDVELDRVRIVGRLAGRWYVAVMIVDGDGNPHGMLGKRSFGLRRAAMAAFADA